MRSVPPLETQVARIVGRYRDIAPQWTPELDDALWLKMLQPIDEDWFVLLYSIEDEATFRQVDALVRTVCEEDTDTGVLLLQFIAQYAEDQGFDWWEMPDVCRVYF